MDSRSRSRTQGDDLDSLEEGSHEHLAADVGVDADQVDAGAGGGPLDRLAQVAGGDAEAELGVGPAGLHELVGVGLHAGWPAAAPSAARRPAVEWSRSSRSSSSKLSTTMRPTPTSRAQASSVSLLLLPWRTSRSGSTPAARATCSSPPVATSRWRPSSSTRRAMARHRNALPA